MKKKPVLATAIFILNFLCLALVLNYFYGRSLYELYGSFIHSFSRLHILFNHIWFGFTALLIPCSIYFTIQGNQSKSKSLLSLSLLAIQISLLTGILMESVEKYPNHNILNHILFACLTFFFLNISYLSNPKFKKMSIAFSVLSLLSLGLAGHYGASIYKGESYIWF